MTTPQQPATGHTVSPTPSLHPSSAAGPVHRFLGLPFLAVIGLAALGLPRVVLHDLGVLTGSSVAAFLLAVGPLVAWVLVAIRPTVRRPFLALLATGALHGLLLAATHQVLWTQAFDGAAPRLGDNLADVDPAVQDVVLRGAAVMSGLHTGIALGAVTGLVAWLVVRHRTPSSAR
ncbi:hypothetical protein [Cellulomonas sp. Leaf395]|uniref:hypothetical protein n=1 Tax=Cellulomonas sp. Leaf395 TaxID=1736362 RepID=UPI000B1E55AB|nr:hypothetical protein [Cellulomonas sp. Leaf395]